MRGLILVVFAAILVLPAEAGAQAGRAWRARPGANATAPRIAGQQSHGSSEVRERPRQAPGHEAHLDPAEAR